MRITYGAETIVGIVVLASPNGRSLVLRFDGGLPSPSGGMYLGTMPVLMDAEGVYRDLQENEPVTVELQQPLQ